MAKLRHLAFTCEDPHKVGEFLQKAFGLEHLYDTGPDVVVLSDGDINFTLLPASFGDHTGTVAWHFGMEMTKDEIEAQRPVLDELGAELHDGVRDGRPVEAFVRTPEGHRIDMAPFWPTKKGQTRRPEGYESRTWKKEPAAANS